MMSPFDIFSSVWIVVTAASPRSGESPSPEAVAALDTRDGHIIEFGVPRLRGIRIAPFPTGPGCLIVTVNAETTVGCMLALGWRTPERLLDLLVEHRNMTNGQTRSTVGGLAGALLSFGLPSFGGLGSGTTPRQLRDRVSAVHGLFIAMAGAIDWGRALLRGRYLVAVARIESAGIPVDKDTIKRLQDTWPAVRRSVINEIDRQTGVFPHARFSIQHFASWATREGISWPRLGTGQLDLSDDVFREMARLHSAVRPIRELRTTLDRFDPLALSLGRDGRNRTPLRPFASTTGRNQPSAKASVLGTAAWVRHLILPAPGAALALIDWSQQEFGIAAALAEDTGMQDAYLSGDPYLAFAIGATGAAHDLDVTEKLQMRERGKACVLGIQYGMGSARLARQLGGTEADATILINAHKAKFSRFWAWQNAIETHAHLHRELRTVLGWRITVGADANPRSRGNFPMQANGAEMLRLACCLCTEAGIAVCAPIHDALLIEAPLDELEDTIATAQRLMGEASEIVLDGFTLRTSVKVVRSPERWPEPRGRALWAAVEEALACRLAPVHQRNASCSPAHPRPIYYCLTN